MTQALPAHFPGSMPARRMATPAPAWLRYGFALPLLFVALLGVSNGSAEGYSFAGIALGLLALYGSGARGRIVVLLALYLLWLGLIVVIGANTISAEAPLRALFGVSIAGLAAALVTIAAVRIGTPWSWVRYDRRAARGRTMREWEWVYIGPAFARQHRLSQSHGPVWFVMAAVLTFGGGQTALAWVTFFRAFDVWQKGISGIAAMSALLVLLLIVTLTVLLTVLWLLRRNTAAWYPTWLFLVLGFPVTLPLIVYWADGVRPNLVYRHRFERLVPLPGDATP